jgi:hypothetical protein
MDTGVGLMDTGAGLMDTGAGDIEMAVPVLGLLMGVSSGSSTLGSLYSARANAASYQYTAAKFAENDRYWADYRKNTGITPKYPYRAGAVNDAGQLYGRQAGIAKGVAGTAKGAVQGARKVNDFYRMW